MFPTSYNLNPKPPPPKYPDFSGYGWIIVICGFFLYFIVDGIAYNLGLINSAWLDEFKQNETATSWIGSIFYAVPLLSAPITAQLVENFGCKTITIFCSFISTFGFVMSSFCRSIEQLYIAVGLIAGFGVSAAYIVGILSAERWFERHRTLAIGIVSSGTGFGTFLIAPITQRLLDAFGWRNTMYFLASLNVLMGIVGFFINEPQWIIDEMAKKSEENFDENRGNFMDHEPNYGTWRRRLSMEGIEELRDAVRSRFSGSYAHLKEVKEENVEKSEVMSGKSEIIQRNGTMELRKIRENFDNCGEIQKSEVMSKEPQNLQESEVMSMKFTEIQKSEVMSIEPQNLQESEVMTTEFPEIQKSEVMSTKIPKIQKCEVMSNQVQEIGIMVPQMYEKSEVMLEEIQKSQDFPTSSPKMKKNEFMSSNAQENWVRMNEFQEFEVKGPQKYEQSEFSSQNIPENRTKNPEFNTKNPQYEPKSCQNNQNFTISKFSSHKFGEKNSDFCDNNLKNNGHKNKIDDYNLKMSPHNLNIDEYFGVSNQNFTNVSSMKNTEDFEDKPVQDNLKKSAPNLKVSQNSPKIGYLVLDGQNFCYNNQICDNCICNHSLDQHNLKISPHNLKIDENFVPNNHNFNFDHRICNNGSSNNISDQHNLKIDTHNLKISIHNLKNCQVYKSDNNFPKISPKISNEIQLSKTDPHQPPPYPENNQNYHNLDISHTKPCLSTIIPKFIKQKLKIVKKIFSHFSNRNFALLAVSTFAIYALYNVPMFFIVELLRNYGYNESQCANFISLVGISLLTGMITLGYVGDVSGDQVKNVNAACVLICGISEVILPSCAGNFTTFCICCVFFGFSLASAYVLIPKIIEMIVGVDEFATAIGLNFFVQGLALLLGIPFASTIYEAIGSWKIAFQICGTIISCGSIFAFLVQVKKE